MSDEMSETKHTAEPWRVTPDADYYDAMTVIRTGGGSPVAKFEGADDAAECVAAVNACRGMADPAKEIAELREERSKQAEDVAFLIRKSTAASVEIDDLKKAVMALAEELHAWREAPHLDHILASYWSDIIACQDNLIRFGMNVNANPIAMAAMKNEEAKRV